LDTRFERKLTPVIGLLGVAKGVPIRQTNLPMPRPSYPRPPEEKRQRPSQAVVAETSIKLQKALADSGLGSRRDMEELIAQGRVTVNGETASIGARVTSQDVIKLSGRRVYLRPAADKRIRVLIYHKPDGEIVSRDDPGGRATVFDQLPKIRGSKWLAVGRLDLTTEGLLLFTTSGDLANRLTHPKFEVEREYAIRILGELTMEAHDQLLKGVELEDGLARFDNLIEAGGEGANRWWKGVVREGRNREVRRLIEAVGLTVSRLIRTRFGPVSLPPQLKRGQYNELDDRTVAQLLVWAGMQVPTRPPRARSHAAGRPTRKTR
jgi:23S rRNA pseudouridine2605 synthase